MIGSIGAIGLVFAIGLLASKMEKTEWVEHFVEAFVLSLVWSFGGLLSSIWSGLTSGSMTLAGGDLTGMVVTFVSLLFAYLFGVGVDKIAEDLK